MAFQLALGCIASGYTSVHRKCDCCGACGGANNLIRVEPVVLTGTGAYTIAALTPADSTGGCGYGRGSLFNNAIGVPNYGTSYSTGFGPWVKIGDEIFFGPTTSSGVATNLRVIIRQGFADGSGALGLGWRLTKTSTYEVSAPISGGWYTLTKVSEAYDNSLGGTFDNSTAMIPFADSPSEVKVLLCGKKITSCSQCNDVESVSIAGSSSLISTKTCSGGIPTVDGTYPLAGMTAVGSTSNKPCSAIKQLSFASCSPGFTDVSVSFHVYGPGTVKPFTSLPSPGSVVVPYPYFSPDRGMRVIVVVAYNSRFLGGGDWNDEHYYLADFETCPEGSIGIPFLVTNNASAPSIGSTPPSSIFVTWPPLL